MRPSANLRMCVCVCLCVSVYTNDLEQEKTVLGHQIYQVTM